jgi:hypothetical protein
MGWAPAMSKVSWIVPPTSLVNGVGAGVGIGTGGGQVPGGRGIPAGQRVDTGPAPQGVDIGKTFADRGGFRSGEAVQGTR